MPLTTLTLAQSEALQSLCDRFHVPFCPSDFSPQFDLPVGWVAGWIGGRTLFVGVSPEGSVHS